MGNVHRAATSGQPDSFPNGGPSTLAASVVGQTGLPSRKEMWKHAENQSFKTSVISLVTTFLVSLTALVLVGSYTIKTCFSEEESKDLHWPRNLDDLKQVSHILQAGVDKHQLLFFYGFSLLYVFKQTFAIPGSLILNVTAGLLFGTVMGTMATTILCSLGGTFCFLLSSRFAGPVVKLDRVKPRVKGFQGKVQQAYAEGTLFFYLLFLRLFPATPNFFINMASYWVGVPVHYFAVSMALGLLPYNFATVNAGSILEKLSSDNPVIDKWVFIRLLCISVVALLPTFFKDKLKQYAGVKTVEVPSEFEQADKTI